MSVNEMSVNELRRAKQEPVLEVLFHAVAANAGVATDDYSPAAPTDPDVRDLRIRLLG